MSYYHQLTAMKNHPKNNTAEKLNETAKNVVFSLLDSEAIRPPTSVDNPATRVNKKAMSILLISIATKVQKKSEITFFTNH